jgi:hypothetical protein
MDKYIFLDIDGVIATPENVKNGTWALVDSKQVLLQDILKRTEAKIVLSSSWRKHTVEDTIQYMREEGFWFADKIVGVTLRAYQFIERGTHLSIPRGAEIKQWIDTHIHSDNGKNWVKKQIGIDYQYVILDDDNDMLTSQSEHFVRCDTMVGLTIENAARAIYILNRKNGILDGMVRLFLSEIPHKFHYIASDMFLWVGFDAAFPAPKNFYELIRKNILFDYEHDIDFTLNERTKDEVYKIKIKL